MSSKTAFEKIRDGLKSSIRHAQGKEVLTTRDVELPEPPKAMRPREIARLRRETIGVSQAVFAKVLNSSAQTVHAWEQGRRSPTGCTLRFLRTIEASNVFGRSKNRKTVGMTRIASSEREIA